MDDKKLILISMVITIIGVLVLVGLLLFFQTPKKEIRSGQMVLTGKIIRTRNVGGITQIMLSTEMNVLVFEGVDLVKGQEVKLVGKLESDGFVAEEITVLDKN